MRITRKIEFDAGHRVLRHESKCKHLHGHRYVAELTVEPKQCLDSIGRVIDFGVLKSIVGQWVDDYWDHNTLLHPDDPLCDTLQPTEENELGRQPYIMQYGNPTAENIARELFEIARKLLEQHAIIVVHVRVYETPNCWSDYDGKYTTG